MRCRFLSLLLAVVLAAPVPAAAPPSRPLDSFGDPLPDGAVARYGTVRLLFRGSIGLKGLEFSPDGTQVLAVGEDRAAVFDVKSGRTLARLSEAYDDHRHDGRPAFAAGVAFIPTNTDDRRLTRWDVRSGRDSRLDWCGGGVCAAALSGDGKRIALACRGGRVAVLDPADEREVITLRDKGGENMRSVALSRDGRLAAAACEGLRLHLWATAGGKLWSCEEPFPYHLTFSPDNRALAYLLKGQLRVRRCADGTLVETAGAPDELLAVRYSPDGKRLLAIDKTARIHTLDPRTGKSLSVVEAALVPRTKRYIHNAAISPDGKVAALYGWWEAIYLLDTATGKPLHPEAAERWLIRDLWQVGKEIVCSQDGGELVFWDPKTGRLTRPVVRLGGGKECDVADLRRDGKVALIQSRTEQRLVDIATGKTVWKRTIPEKAGEQLGRFCPDGKLIAAWEKEIVLRDAATGERVRGFGGEDQDEDTRSPLWSPDGRLIALRQSKTHRLKVFEVASGRARLSRREYRPGAAAFSPDGRSLAVDVQAGVCFWQVNTARRQEWETRGGTLAFSPDGKLLAIVSAYTVEVRDAGGRPLAQLYGHDTVAAVLFTADGRSLITAGRDGTALVWDVQAVTRRRKSDKDDTPVGSAWQALAGEDAEAAGAALAALQAKPAEAVALAREHLTASRETASEKDIAGMVRDLDHEDAAVRRAASAALLRLDVRAEAQLRTALRSDSAEVRRAAKRLLDRIGSVEDPHLLRQVRAVEMLEHVATPAARDLLKSLAKGADSRQTREAKAAVARLAAKR